MKSEKGFSLVEVLVALALLGIIGAAFLGSLATASKSILIADERTTAESLARSQMENVKNQLYEIAEDGSEVTYDKITEITPGYTICSVNRADITVEDIKGVPWISDPLVNQPAPIDIGLQRIKLIIYHPYDPIHPDENIVITLEDYKVDR